MLTQKQLKEVIHYNPKTGIFRWRSSRVGVLAWSVAGTNCNGYIAITIYRKIYYAHRLAFLYVLNIFPKEADHRDRIKNNNRWENLREVTRIINNRNKGIQTNNKSGVVGVHWCKRSTRWIARVKINNRYQYLGSFKNKKYAIKARKDAELKYNYHNNHGVAK